MEKHSDPRSLRSTRLLKMADMTRRASNKNPLGRKALPSFGKRRPK